MLTLDNITCIRGGKLLFRHLGLTVGDCCLVAVTGANGSGKSSILRIMAGLLRPTEGTVLYANEPIDGEYALEYCDILHYIGHKSGLNGYMTVRENLTFWAALRGNVNAMLGAALHFFELEAVQDVPVGRLSMGWQKRVTLARLLLRQSEIWLLDEPYAYLDAQGSRLLDGLIQARIDQGGSVVIATNDTITLPGCYELALGEFQS